MEATKKVRLKIDRASNGLDTKLFIIKRLRGYDEPISMYQFAKDCNMDRPNVHYHFKPLMECGVIIIHQKKYQINPCFKYVNDILEILQPFFECLAELNSDLNTNQLSDLASYLLAMISIEVDGNED